MGNIGFDPDRIKQEPEGQEVYGMLKQAYQKEMSRTWKERHAKGVPVKILSQEDHDSWYQLDTDKWYEGDHIVQLDNPVVRIYNFPMSAGLWDRVASFRNFRYKPEWLEKKKREPYLCKQERCFGKWDCDKVGCWRNRKPDLGYSDFDSPPIGGFKD